MTGELDTKPGAVNLCGAAARFIGGVPVMKEYEIKLGPIRYGEQNDGKEYTAEADVIG